MSEYMRALKLQKENKIDDALSLFSELLDTEILFEVNSQLNNGKIHNEMHRMFEIFDQVTKTHTSKTLISIKYNCYKNIAFIHSNRKDNDLALDFLLKVCDRNWNIQES